MPSSPFTTMCGLQAVHTPEKPQVSPNVRRATNHRIPAGNAPDTVPPTGAYAYKRRKTFYETRTWRHTYGSRWV